MQYRRWPLEGTRREAEVRHSVQFFFYVCEDDVSLAELAWATLRGHHEECDESASSDERSLTEPGHGDVPRRCPALVPQLRPGPAPSPDTRRCVHYVYYYTRHLKARQPDKARALRQPKN